MAEEATAGPRSRRLDWRRALWLSAVALVATLALIALIFMVTLSNRARDDALGWRAAHLRRDAAHPQRRRHHRPLRGRARPLRARREATTTGTAYYNEWRCAGHQIGQLQPPGPRRSRRSARRVGELRALFQRRGAELAPAAARRRSAARARAGSTASTPRAGPPTLAALRGKLAEIAASRARQSATARMAETQGLVTRADTYTDWLGWLGDPDRPRRDRPRRRSPGAPSPKACRRGARPRAQTLRALDARGGGAGAHRRSSATPTSALQGRGGRARRRRGAAPPGPEDGGGRPADRRHRPRFQQHAGGRRRRHRSRPAQASTARAARSSSTSTMRWRAPPAPPR